MKVIIVGAGGHAQVVADILFQMKRAGKTVNPIGYVDDDPDLIGQERLGLPVLGKVAELKTTPHDAVVVAIGDNQIRECLFNALRERGEQFLVARHPTAVIASDVTVGASAMICAGVVVNSGSSIGNGVILNTACTVDHHNRIGDHAHVAPGVHLGGDVIVGAGTLIGIGATVMPQRRVGEWCTIGAATLVHEDLADGVTAVGVPARIMRPDTGG